MSIGASSVRNIKDCHRGLPRYFSIPHQAGHLIASLFTLYSSHLVTREANIGGYSGYIFTLYVILAPVKEKTVRAVVHAVVTKLICEHPALRVLLNDNGAEFRNTILQEICTQFGITQTFTVAYHLPRKGLVERTNRKFLDVLRPVVGRLLGTWGDWLSQVAATINATICESTGQAPHFSVFVIEKRLPHALLMVASHFHDF